MKRYSWFAVLALFIGTLSGCDNPVGSGGTSGDGSGGPSGSAEVKVAAPSFSIPQGELENVPETVSFLCDTAGVTFYYTTDGTNPTSSSASGNSMVITEAVTLRLIAKKSGFTDSDIVSAEYTVKDRPSNEARLTQLGLSAGIFTPAFSGDIGAYTVIIPDSAGSVTLTPVARGPGAAIKINGSEAVSGSESGPVTASNGGQAVITVCAQDGTTNRTYTLTFKTAGYTSWTETALNGSRSTNAWRYAAGSDDGNILIIAGSSTYVDSQKIKDIYRSNNAGATWSKCEAAGSQSWSALACSSDAQTIAAAYDYNYGDNRIIVSRNGGNSWSVPQKLGDGTITAVRMSDTGKDIYILTTGYQISGLYRSSDYGSTWTEIVRPAAINTWTDIACTSSGAKVIALGTKTDFPDRGTHIHTSENYGITWTTAKLTPDTGQTYSTYLAISGDGTKMAVSTNFQADSWYKEVYYSDNSGASWKRLNYNWFSSYYVTSIYFSKDGSKLFCTKKKDSNPNAQDNEYYLWRSDNGSEFQLLTTDEKPWIVTLAVSNNGSKLLALSADEDGSFSSYPRTSTDSGASWTVRENIGYRDWRRVRMSRDGLTGIAFFRSANSYNMKGKLMVSTNSGQTWTEKESAGRRDWRDAAASGNGQVIAATSYEFPDTTHHISVNGGNSWSIVPVSGGWTYPTAFVSDDGNTILFANDFGRMMVSGDRGSSWREILKPGDSNNSSFPAYGLSADGNTIIAAGFEVWISHDKGVTWTKTSPGGAQYINVNGTAVSADGRYIALTEITNNKVYVSADGGESWAAKTIPVTVKQWTGISISDDGRGIAVTGCSTIDSYSKEVTGAGPLVISFNRGETWNECYPAGSRLWTSVAVTGDFSGIIGSALFEIGLFKNGG
ncbi:VPS10 domain-containing protein [Breznakiella homolactica]|uniref:Cadherin-like beta sandwich domain-containing protein n=1 Tax=Breznakiella homolactica TaxID=2798577 RepID=A0A7T7XNY9_9SPIR|nr:cadherin-like beta sandwich domain-containing protein [Breznakiella homolactica]QQO09762.1 cadherin-like beta sandwich domain-containing protein [Breznakiella homolactica]